VAAISLILWILEKYLGTWIGSMRISMMSFFRGSKKSSNFFYLRVVLPLLMVSTVIRRGFFSIPIFIISP
jgi:hypothetical protein